jgi:hypothetical protein
MGSSAATGVQRVDRTFESLPGIAVDVGVGEAREKSVHYPH